MTLNTFPPPEMLHKCLLKESLTILMVMSFFDKLQLFFILILFFYE